MQTYAQEYVFEHAVPYPKLSYIGELRTDSLLIICNPNIKKKGYFGRKGFIEKQSNQYFVSTRLDFHIERKQSFESNIVKENSFVLIDISAFIYDYIYPHIQDTIIKTRLDSTYKNTDFIKNKKVFEVNGHDTKKAWGARYFIVSYPSDRFLVFLVPVNYFNMWYNSIMDPPQFYLYNNPVKNGVFLKIIVPVVNFSNTIIE